jgi:hypothetical protein
MIVCTIIDVTLHGYFQDRVSWNLQAASNLIYTIYTPVEHIAWLSDLQLLNGTASKWYNYCLYLWLAALICSIARYCIIEH